MSDIVDNANKNISESLNRQLDQQCNVATEPVYIVEGKHICIDCDNPIGLARVSALPNAPRCIVCQTKKEKKEKQFA